ncbi:MAG: hypothetical protein LJE62_14605 [Silicimonas sp.]|jgi:hypothetical protein|nr:hypothetical protein [Silicimonas sp.]
MRYALLSLTLVLGACGQIFPTDRFDNAPPPSIDDATGLELPGEDARTIEDFDTTSATQRDAAASASAGGNVLGTTVASLGDAGAPGFWMETPLVDAPAKGRIRNPKTGRTVAVDLRPIAGGSSRVSLAALRLLDAPLTELVTLEVYLN